MNKKVTLFYVMLMVRAGASQSFISQKDRFRMSKKVKNRPIIKVSS
jgi:hypothetical protein